MAKTQEAKKVEAKEALKVAVEKDKKADTKFDTTDSLMESSEAKAKRAVEEIRQRILRNQ